jgi:hypothetical protein
MSAECFIVCLPFHYYRDNMERREGGVVTELSNLRKEVKSMSAKARRILASLRDPKERERMMESMNRDNTDSTTLFGGREQEVRALREK